MATPEPSTKRVEITISTRTLATILGTIAFVWAFVAARQAVLWIFIALFLAIVLSTPVSWLEERRGMKRASAAILVVLGLAVVLGILAYLLVSPFVGAVRDLIEDLPSIVERIRASELFQDIDRRTDLGEELQGGPSRSRPIFPRSSATHSRWAGGSSASVSARSRSPS